MWWAQQRLGQEKTTYDAESYYVEPNVGNIREIGASGGGLEGLKAQTPVAPDLSTEQFIGASSGIGLAFARELARRGHRVLAVARRRDRLETLARESVERGGSIVPLAADLRTGEGLALVIELSISVSGSPLANLCVRKNLGIGLSFKPSL